MPLRLLLMPLRLLLMTLRLLLMTLRLFLLPLRLLLFAVNHHLSITNFLLDVRILLGTVQNLTSSDHKDVPMITIRHIERLFDDHQHRRLYRELIAGRPEATFALEAVLARPVPIAALGMLRLDELSQSHTALYRRLLN